jgi:hypothetical protein
VSETLRIDLRPSRLLAVALMLVHGLALYAFWISLPGWPAVLAGVVVLVSLAGTLARARQRIGRSVVSLEMAKDGRASWKDRRGAWHQGILGESHFVSVFLVVVDLRPLDGGATRVILLADSVAPDDFRRLRVWLRWRPGPANSGRNNLTEN